MRNMLLAAFVFAAASAYGEECADNALLRLLFFAFGMLNQSISLAINAQRISSPRQAHVYRAMYTEYRVCPSEIFSFSFSYFFFFFWLSKDKIGDKIFRDSIGFHSYWLKRMKDSIRLQLVNSSTFSTVSRNPLIASCRPVV